MVGRPPRSAKPRRRLVRRRRQATAAINSNQPGPWPCGCPVISPGAEPARYRAPCPAAGVTYDLAVIQVLAARRISGSRSGRGRFWGLDRRRAVPGNRPRHRDGANNMPDALAAHGRGPLHGDAAPLLSLRVPYRPSPRPVLDETGPYRHGGLVPAICSGRAPQRPGQGGP